MGDKRGEDADESHGRLLGRFEHGCRRWACSACCSSTPWLHVLPLHAACDDRGRAILDDFEVRYAPSSTLARISRERHTASYRNRALLAVQPADQPGFAQDEVVAVRGHMGDDTLVVEGRRRPGHDPRRGTPALSLPLRWARQLRAGFASRFVPGAGRTVSPERRGALRQRAVALPDRAGLPVGCETALSDPRDLIDDYVGIAGGFLFGASQRRVHAVAGGECRRPAAHGPLLWRRWCFSGPTSRRRRAGGGSTRGQLWLRDLTASELHAHFRRPECRLSPEARTRLEKEFRDRAKALGKRPFSSPIYWAGYVLSSGLPALPGPWTRLRSVGRRVQGIIFVAAVPNPECARDGPVIRPVPYRTVGPG